MAIIHSKHAEDLHGQAVSHSTVPAKQFDREPAEIIADILSRYTVLDLVEMTDEQLERGGDRLAKSDKPITVTAKGEQNYIKWWRIVSDGREYEVRRFENFVFCSCLDFFFNKTVCRHIYVTTRDFVHRQHREMDNAPYLKPTGERKTERLGGVRF